MRQRSKPGDPPSVNIPHVGPPTVRMAPGAHGYDGLNADIVSARLCSEAKAGQVLVSQRVYGRIEPGVSAEPAGEAVLKGFHRPVPMFNVIALK